MRQEVKIPRGWRRGTNAISQPRLAKTVLASLPTPTVTEVLNVVQPDAKAEEKENKSKRGKKEKVIEPATQNLDVLVTEDQEVIPSLLEEGEKNGDD